MSQTPDADDQKIRCVMAESLGLETAQLADDTSMLVADLGADSIDLLDAFYRLGREFKIELDRDEILPRGEGGPSKSDASVGEVVELVRDKLASRSR